MDVQSESADPPPGEPQPAGKIRKGFKLFGKRKSGSIFSIRKGEGNNKPPIARSKTLDGLTDNSAAPDSEQEPEKELETEHEEKVAEASPGENGQTEEEGSFGEDGVPSASPPRMSICSTTSVKSLGFMSLLRGGRSRGGGGDRRVQTVSHPTGRQRRGLKNLFSGVSFRHKDKDGATPPSPLLMSSRTSSVEIIKEQLGLTPKPPPRCLEDDPGSESDTETSDPASRLTPQDSPSMTLSETTAPRAPAGNVSETTEDVPPPVPTTAPPPLEPGEASLGNLLADISSLLTFDSISSGGDFMADVEAEWGKLSPVRAGEKLPVPTVSSKPASPSVSVVTMAKPSCPPAATSAAKPTSVSTFPITQTASISIITTKPSTSTTPSVMSSAGPTLASEPTTTTTLINPTPTATATMKPLTVTVTVPVPSASYSTPVIMSSFSKGFPPFKPAPTTIVTTKPFTAPITSTSYSSSPVMSSPSATTIKPTPCPASVTITTPSVTPPATVLSTATAKSTPEAAPNIVSKPYPVATPNVAMSPLATPNITPISKPSPETTPNIAMSPVATPNITPVNKPSPETTPNIKMSPVAKPNTASVIKPSPEATPPPTISKSAAVSLSNATPVLLTTTTQAKTDASAIQGSSSYKPNLTPVAAESKAQTSLSSACAVTSQPPTPAPVASSNMPTCPMPTTAPDSPCAAPLQPKPSPGPLGLTKDLPSLVPTPDPVKKAPLDVASTPAPILSSTKPQHVPTSTPLSLEKTTTPSFAAVCLDKMPLPERITAPATTNHATVPVPIAIPSPTHPIPSFTPTPTPICQSETPQFKSTAPVLIARPAPTLSPSLGEPLTSSAKVKANGQTNGGLVIPNVMDGQGGQTVSPKYEEPLNESRAIVQAPSKEKRTLSKIPVVGGGRGGKLPQRDNQHVDDGSDGSLDPPTPVLEEERPRLGLHEAGVKNQIGDSEAGAPASRHSHEESQSQPHQAKVVSGLPRESKIPVKHGAQSHPASQIPQAKEPPRTKIPVSKVPVRRAGNKPAAAGMSSQIRK